VARAFATLTGVRFRRSWLRWARRTADVFGFAVICAAAIWLAVQITPMQSVNAAGQTVMVGATSPRLTGSGPGELELFGQVIATRAQFAGPIRPRLKLTHITMNAQVEELVRSNDHGRLGLSGRLTDGWKRYCLWESLGAAGFAALLSIAAVGVRGWPRAMKMKFVLAALISVIALNSTGVYLLASGTPKALQRVTSMDDLVGANPQRTVPTARGPALRTVQAVVLGDSTAAAIGNPLVDRPSAEDRACGRSRDSYAAYLAQANRWNILNLACSNATVNDGLLGVQITGDHVAPPQLSVAKRAPNASVIIVSIGANDVRWADLTRLCVAMKVCGDRASTAYFQQQLSGFAHNYYELLRQLAALPQHPTVLVNEYYDPLGPDLECLRREGFTPSMAAALQGRLADLNQILSKGARTFGFTPVPQHFGGHEMCTDDPFVQGPGAEAPLHPTAAGELAIALADQQALAAMPRPAVTPSVTPSP
jgi:lysophospholipase L1-like esterase